MEIRRELQHFAVMVHRVSAGTKCGHELSLDSGSKRCFDSFRRAEKVEGFHVARILSQSRLCELFCKAHPLAKLVRLLAVDLRLAFSVSAGAVERRLELPRLIQLLQPQARRHALRSDGIIGSELDHLLKTAARGFVVEVVECFVSFRAQSVETRLLVLGQSGDGPNKNYQD